MATASVFSESPGSETSEAPPNADNAAHFFPFSIMRTQRSTVSQTPPLDGEKQKSFQGRIPMFKSMMTLTSLRDEHSKSKANGHFGSDATLASGELKTSLSRKASNLKTYEDGATLVWKDLTVTVGERRDGVLCKAVQGVTGYARPGTMLAIMGPPDCGKSTLLQALAGKLPRTAKVYGEILLNGQHQHLKIGTYAHVTQEDDLIETLTIREALFYSALLQLPDRLPCSEKIARVDTLISEMDLEDLAGARIGKCGKNGGLSKGKRRRVSIAMQLLTKPWLVFVDEPINMLDSVSAFVVIGMLKKLSSNGCTVVMSLGNMSSDVFGLLDKVCLLSSGKTIFFGPASAALEHYANVGVICPTMYNPADHLLRAINTDYDRVNAPLRFGQDSEHGDMWGQMDTAVIIRTLLTTYQTSGDSAVVQSMVAHLSEKEKSGLGKGNHCSPLTQLGVLTWRSFLNMWRDFNYFWLRLILSTALTLCIGTLGFKIGHSYSSVPVKNY